jgi:hypothetical protein
VLIPGGTVALAQAWRRDRRYLPLAAFPALFGVQQVLEGWVWRGLAAGDEAVTQAAALAFLFFAYQLWPALTPFAAARLETDERRRRACLALAGFGAVFGFLLYAPVAALPGALEVHVAGGSISYGTRLLQGDDALTAFLRLLYGAVICVPLLASSAPGVRGFGLLVATSMLATYLVAAYAFTSIWCYLAAVVSTWLVGMVSRLPRPGDPAMTAALAAVRGGRG